VPGVGFVVRGSLADKAGFRADDLVTDLNGEPIFNLSDMGPIIDANRGKEVVFTVERGAESLQLPMALPPPSPDGMPVDFGIEWGRTTLA